MKNPIRIHAFLSMLLCAAFFPVAGPFAHAKKADAEERIDGNAHIYKKAGGREMKLYVVTPAEAKPGDKRPAIVFFHGGGWTGGSVTQFNEHAKYLATRGMVCVNVDYRLIPRDKGTPLVCIQDAKSAMRWVRSHAAELGIDSNRIASAGGSAGGHLAAVVGTIDRFDDPADDKSVSAKSQAMVLFNPVIDNGPGTYRHDRFGDNYKEFSPADNITKDAPPAIILVGTQDKLVPKETVLKFQKNMRDAGVRCDAVLYEGQGHGFFNMGKRDNKYHYETLLEADKFLVSIGWLSGPPTLKMPASKRNKQAAL